MILKPSSSVFPHFIELPRTSKFTASQLKHYLPIHFPTLKGNILSILNNILPQFQNHSVFYPDVHLSTTLQQKGLQQIQSRYDNVKIAWCQDIDNQQHHLKKSLQLSVILVDYLAALSQSQSNKYSIHKSRQLKNLISKLQVITLLSGNQQYKKVIPPQQLNNNSFFNFKKKIYAYYLWKQKLPNGKNVYYFSVAHNNYPCQSIMSLLRAFRSWNCKRLNSNVNIHDQRILEHLFSIGRSFLIGQKNQDFNPLKHHLKKINQKIQNLEYSSLKLIDVCKNQDYFYNFLQDKNSILITYKCNLIFKPSSSSDHKSFWSLLSQILCQILTACPLKHSISYKLSTFQIQNSTDIKIIFSSSYSIKNQQVIRINGNDVQRIILAASQFLRNCFHNQSITAQNIADQLFRKSMQILNKFSRQPSQQKKSIYPSPQKISKTSKQKPKVELQTQHSNFIKNQKTSQNLTSIPQFTQNPNQYSLRIQNSYYQLLKKIQLNKPIKSIQHLYQRLKSINILLQQKHNLCSPQPFVNQQMIKIIKSIAKLAQICTIQQITTLLYNSTNQYHSQIGFSNTFSNNLYAATINTQCLLQIFFQPQQYQLAVKVTQKIAKDGHLISAFKNYINEGLSKSRFTLLIQMVKKISIRYSYNLNITQLDFSEIQTQDIISIVDDNNSRPQNKNYRVLVYKGIIKKVMPTLFKNIPNRFPILSVIYIFYQMLSQTMSNHSTEHIYSFLTQLAFESIYYANDSLDNVVFLKNQIYKQQIKSNAYIRNKKILQIIRNYGLRGLGFECRTHFIDYFFKDPPINICKLKNPIYYVVSISNSQYLKRFLQILQKSHHTPALIMIIKFYNFKKDFINQLSNHKINYLMYLKDISQFSFQKQLLKIQQHSVQQYLLSGAKNSQSGIFQHLLSYNPLIKIAGLPLSKILQSNSQHYKYEQLSKSIYTNDSLKKDIFNVDYTIGYTFPQSYQQSSQMINLILDLKDKYIRYNLLDEDQQTYFRQIVNQVIQKKDNILAFIQFGNKFQQYYSFLLESSIFKMSKPQQQIHFQY